MCFLKFSDDVQRLIFILEKEKLGWLYLQHENSGCLGYHIKGAERVQDMYTSSLHSQTHPSIYLIQ